MSLGRRITLIGVFLHDRCPVDFFAVVLICWKYMCTCVQWCAIECFSCQTLDYFFNAGPMFRHTCIMYHCCAVLYYVDRLRCVLYKLMPIGH